MVHASIAETHSNVASLGSVAWALSYEHLTIINLVMHQLLGYYFSMGILINQRFVWHGWWLMAYCSTDKKKQGRRLCRLGSLQSRLENVQLWEKNMPPIVWAAAATSIHWLTRIMAHGSVAEGNMVVFSLGPARSHGPWATSTGPLTNLVMKQSLLKYLWII